MSRQTTLSVIVDDGEASAYTSLVPEGCEPDEIQAWIRSYNGTTSSGMTVYWRGKQPDGTPHLRRTSRSYVLTPNWARLLGLASPPSLSDLEGT